MLMTNCRYYNYYAIHRVSYFAKGMFNRLTIKIVNNKVLNFMK